MKHPEESFRRTLLITLLFVIPLTVILNPLWDPDIWWHLQTGKWIVMEKALPSTDLFSVGGEAKEWMVYSWLFEVLIYLSFQGAGFAGILYFQSLLALLIVWRIYSFYQQIQPDFGKSIPIIAFVFIIALSSFSPRPWLFSFLFVLLEMEILFASASEKGSKYLYALPLLFCLWANLHIQFIYGLVILFFWTVESFICYLFSLPGSYSFQKKYLYIFFLSLGATLINPYHIGVYLEVWTYAGQWEIYPLIQELSPHPFDHYWDWMVLGIGLGAVFALGIRKEKRPLPYLLLIFSFVAGMRMIRDSWLLALVSGAILAGYPSRDPSAIPYLFSKKQKGISFAVVVLFFLLLHGERDLSSKGMERAWEKIYPGKALRFLKEKHYEGPIFSYFDWGGFLIWNLPQNPVYMDGRTNVYGSEKVKEHFLTWQAYPIWKDHKELFRAKIILAPRDEPLTSLLRIHPHFKLIYEDKRACIFLPRQN